MTVIILIPARIDSTRLPGKPLADIAGKPMIAQVVARALESKVGRVIVATDSQAVAAAVQGEGVEAVLTRSDHETGSDRIFEALQLCDPEGKAAIIVNLQGDLPTIAPEDVRAVLKPLENSTTDIATLGVIITNEDEKANPNVVKIVGVPENGHEDRLRALYFTRATAPWGDGPLFHHIGIYAYRRAALERFVAAPEGVLEKRERLEQLRALEAGLRIDVEIVQTVPLGVDTPADLEKARQVLAKKV